MKDRTILLLLLAITGASLFINVKFAMAAMDAQDFGDKVKQDPVGTFRGLLGI